MLKFLNKELMSMASFSKILTHISARWQMTIIIIGLYIDLNRCCLALQTIHRHYTIFVRPHLCAFTNNFSKNIKLFNSPAV